MSLIIPPFGFANFADNTDIAVPYPPGIVVTAGGTAHTDGSVVTLLSALAFDCQYLYLYPNGWSANGQARTALMDVMIDYAGGTAWATDPLISDISAGQASPGWPFHFPIWIPAGASLGVRLRSAQTSWTGNVYAAAYGDPSRPDMWWAGTGADSIGTTPASSSGTAVTAGTAAWGSWTDIGSPTSRPYGAFQVSFHGSQAATTTGTSVWQIGIGGVALPYPAIATTYGSTETITVVGGGPAWLHVPAGTQFQMRGADPLGAVVRYWSIQGIY